MRVFLILLLMLLSSHVFSDEISFEHALWNGIPVVFTVPVGSERILKFPNPVTLNNTNAQLTTDKVRILNNDGFLYIKAKKSFSAIRLALTDVKTGEVILVDLSAQKDGSDTPLEIVLDKNTSDNNKNEAQKSIQAVSDVTLMRYAIKNLYAPKRLIKENDAISRVPMMTHKSIDLFNNGSLLSMPLSSWQSGDLIVTAILIKNTQKQKVVLDPQNINGSFIAASFYPTNYVDPNGNNHDRTTLFLISNTPFNDALHTMGDYTK